MQFSTAILTHNNASSFEALRGLCELILEAGCSDLLLIDQASRDQTAMLIDSIEQAHRPLVRVVKRSENKMGSARQQALSLAVHGTLLFVDTDCQFLSLSQINRMIDEFHLYRKGDHRLVGMAPILVNKVDSSWDDSLQLFCKSRLLSGGSHQVFQGPFPAGVPHLSTTCLILDVERAHEAGGFNGKMEIGGEDLEFGLRAFHQGRVWQVFQNERVFHRIGCSLSSWLKKIFRYGQIQPFVFVEMLPVLDPKRGLLVALPFVSLLIPIVLPKVLTAYFFLFTTIAILYFLMTYLETRSLAKAIRLWVFSTVTHLVYFTGVVLFWLPKKKERQ